MKISSFFSSFLCVFVFVISSCAHKSGPTIGFMLPHLNASVKRYLIERDEFTKKVKDLGGEVIFMSADNDERKQLQQVEELLQKGIDILVLDPVNRFTAAEMVRKAHDKGVQVISYDRLVANCNIDAFITFDPSAIGNQMVDYALKRTGGNYFILGGDKTDLNAVMIDEAIHKSLSASASKVNVVYSTFIEKYDIQDASYEVNKYLDLSMQVPDVILASSDALAKGAVDALKNSHVEKKVIITGQGGEVFACRDILSGKQSMTIYKPVRKMADMAAEIAVNLTKGKKINSYFKTKIFNGTLDVPSMFMDVITVDNTNLRSTVEADGLVSENELREAGN